MRSFALLSCLCLSLALPASSFTEVAWAGSARQAKRVKPQTQRQNARSAARTQTRSRRGTPRMTVQEANRFMRTPKGQAKLQSLKQKALDKPAGVMHTGGFGKPTIGQGSRRDKMSVAKLRSKVIAGFSVIGSTVTGVMGGVFGGALKMMGGGMAGTDLLAGGHPAAGFFSSGHFVTGAIVGVGVTLVGGLTAAYGFRRQAKKIERQAEVEATADFYREMGARP